MQPLLILNIKSLCGISDAKKPLRGSELKHFNIIDDAFLIIENGRIAEFGLMQNLPKKLPQNKLMADGQFVLPAWCDSHTHLVFAKSRESELLHKINGLSYAEIAARGGGILNSAKAIEAINEDELFLQSWQRLQEVMSMGTGAIEIKSGYGLSLVGELKMLRVIKKLKQQSPIPIKATFLGAHAVPMEYKENRDGYINLIIEEMLPQVVAEQLADYIDVFCEKGFYTPDEMRRISLAGIEYGLKPKLHVNQLNSIGGLQAGLALNALSVDHLEVMADEDIKDLAAHPDTIGTLLPTAAFYLNMPLQPARKLIEADCALALASDYNPGSSPSGNMNFVVSLSCIQMKMLPQEAIQAATINGAFAMDLAGETGSIAIGKRANFIFTKPIPSLAYLPYAFAHNNIESVMINGEFLNDKL